MVKFNPSEISPSPFGVEIGDVEGEREVYFRDAEVRITPEGEGWHIQGGEYNEEGFFEFDPRQDYFVPAQFASDLAWRNEDLLLPVLEALEPLRENLDSLRLDLEQVSPFQEEIFQKEKRGENVYSGPRLGRFLKILGDRKITREEAQQLPDLVFNDGYFDFVEAGLVNYITENGTRFEDTRDRLFFETLKETIHCWNEKKCRANRGLPFDVARRWKENPKTGRNGHSNAGLHVTDIEQYAHGSFYVSYQQAGQQKTWQSLRPLRFPDLLSMLLGLEDFRRSSPDFVARRGAQFLQGHLASRLQKMDPYYSREDFYALYRDEGQRKPENLKSWPVVVGDYSFFFGEKPPSEPYDAIFRAMESLPPVLREQMVRDGKEVHLFHFGRDHAPTNWHAFVHFRYGGHVRNNKAFVNIDNDPQFVALATVHEIIHLFFESFPFGLLEHHIEGLRWRQKRDGRERFARRYQEQSASEWVADAMTIFYLGRRGNDFRLGLSSFYNGLYPGFKELLRRFRRADPQGYLMILKADQYLREGKDPSLAFSYEIYGHAAKFLAGNFGRVDDVLEKLWLDETRWQHPPDFSFEMGTRRSGMLTYGHYSLKELRGMVERFPHYFSLRKEYVRRNFLAHICLMMYGKFCVQEKPAGAFSETIDHIEAALREYPFDKELAGCFVLAELFLKRETRSLLKDHFLIPSDAITSTTFRADPELVRRIEAMGKNLRAAYPGVF